VPLKRFKFDKRTFRWNNPGYKSYQRRSKKMRTTLLPLIIASFIILLIAGCVTPDQVEGNGSTVEPEPVVTFTPPEEGYPTEDALLCTIYFYTGTNVGDRSLTTGPQVSTDEGMTWTHMAWEEIITNGIAVGPYGKMLYCACGNGVLSSTDGGRNWKVNGGWRMAEIQDIAIGPESPLVAWAAGAYGLFLTEDGAETWSRPGMPQPFRYIDNVTVDRENGDHVLIGTEDGLFRTKDHGQSYEKIGPVAPVRCILQDSRDPQTFWVATDGEGLWKTEDGCDSCQRVYGTGDIVNRVIQSPHNPEHIICGLYHGVAISHDDGESWEQVTDGFGEFSPMYALLVDKDNPDRLYGGSRDGFYISDDGGFTWEHPLDAEGNIIMEEAVILDLWQGELYRGAEEPSSSEPGTLVVNTIEPEGDEFRGTFVEGIEERGHTVGAMMADRAEERLPELEEGRHIGPYQAIALIKEGRASEALFDDLRAKYSDVGHSMFDSFPAMSLYMHCKDELPDDVKELLRQGLVSTNIYRGDTENHWLMWHTALLLAAQEWSESSAGEWFTGHTTQENYEDAKGWIEEWIRITTTIGQGEFDSPHYYNTYMAPCLLLYDFVEDPMLKRKVGMVLDILMVDMAAESLYGRYCGGHSRMYDPTVIRGAYDNCAGYYYVFLGEIDPPENFHSWALNGAYSSYRCPKIIADVALTRDEVYVHTEVKRVRNQMRYSELLNSPVYKYDYMTPDWCLGSLQGGILQPIQQHTWDVTWIGSADNTTLFSLHPYYSAFELAMFFPEDPHMLTASVQAQKSTYTNPQKLNSSSPYERVFQHEDTLMAVYNIPEGTDHNHVTLYVPDCLNKTIENGWIFGQDGNCYVAVYPCTEGEWYDEPVEGFPPAQRMQIPAGQTAIVTEIGRPAVDGTFDEFKAGILGLPAPGFTESEDGPVVMYVNHHGTELSYAWIDEAGSVNDIPYIFPSDMLFDGPFVRGGVNTGIITITAGGEARVLNFNDLTITQAVEVNEPS